MSALSTVSNSAGVSYATQLAQSSSVERSLYGLGVAVQSGNLTKAGAVLNALMAANPQFAASSGSSTQSQDPINQDFQNLAKAISGNQTDAARNAWTQLRNDLAKQGVTANSNGSDLAAQAVAKSKATMEQSLVSSLFGGGTGGTSEVATLLGGSGAASSDPISALVSNWLTYKSSGGASVTSPTDQSGSILNLLA